MGPVLRIIFTIYCCIVFKKVCSQITAPIESENNCFNGLMRANCSQSTGRAFVIQANVGCKYTSRYSHTDTSLCPYFWTSTVADGCCSRDPDDCVGNYDPVDADPYRFHKDCIGKNICAQRVAARMDTIYLECNASIYPAQTTYFYIDFYCIDINSIGELSNANKQNDGAGSTLYLWSGTTTYQTLPATTYTCSVETDCEDTITVLSLDFRFSDDDVNQTCFDDNKLTLSDSGVSREFTCATSYNNFTITTLYTSTSNYISITYTGITAGGYLWLALQSTSNGNLTLNCQSPTQINVCETTTEPETTTTEQTTTTTEPETTTTEPETTTTEPETTTTEPETTTAEQTTTSTEQSTTTTEQETSTQTTTTTEHGIPSSSTQKTQKPTLFIIIGIVVIIIVVAVVVTIIVCYRKYKKKKEEDVENPHRRNIRNEDSEVVKNTNIGSSIGSSDCKLHAISITHINGYQDTTKHIEKPAQEFPVETQEEMTTDTTHIPTSLPPITVNLLIDENKAKKRKKKKKKILEDNGEIVSETKQPEDLETFVEDDHKGENTLDKTYENQVGSFNINSKLVEGDQVVNEETENKPGKKKKKKRKKNRVHASNEDLTNDNIYDTPTNADDVSFPKQEERETLDDFGATSYRDESLDDEKTGKKKKKKKKTHENLEKEISEIVSETKQPEDLETFVEDDHKGENTLDKTYENQVGSFNINSKLVEGGQVVNEETENKPEKKKKKKRKKNRVHASNEDLTNDNIYDTPTNADDVSFPKQEERETLDDFGATSYRNESLDDEKTRKKKKKKKKTHENLAKEIRE